MSGSPVATQIPESPPAEAFDGPRHAHARLLAGCVERAAERLPGTSKCLPKAVALQVLLRLAGIPSRLVIAFHVTDRTGPDAYHAWTEVCGEMLVGECNRAEYRSIMTFDQPRPVRDRT